jgi:hypothetical protein
MIELPRNLPLDFFPDFLAHHPATRYHLAPKTRLPYVCLKRLFLRFLLRLRSSRINNLPVINTGFDFHTPPPRFHWFFDGFRKIVPVVYQRFVLHATFASF